MFTKMSSGCFVTTARSSSGKPISFIVFALYPFFLIYVVMKIILVGQHRFFIGGFELEPPKPIAFRFHIITPQTDFLRIHQPHHKPSQRLYTRHRRIQTQFDLRLRDIYHTIPNHHNQIRNLFWH